MQGRVSQIFFIHVLVKILLNVENLLRKKDLNLPVFCHKIKTTQKIKNLRHYSLHCNVFYGS